MGHQHGHVFRSPAKFFRVLAADVLAVDIAIDAAEGAECGQLAGNRFVAEIAGVPNLVAGFEVPEYGIVEEVMCIRQQADAEHKDGLAAGFCSAGKGNKGITGKIH